MQVQQFPVNSPGEPIQLINMPSRAKILDAACNGGRVVIVVEHDGNPDALWARRFAVVSSDQAFDAPDRKYLATVVAGAFLWHVYELKS